MLLCAVRSINDNSARDDDRGDRDNLATATAVSPRKRVQRGARAPSRLQRLESAIHERVEAAEVAAEEAAGYGSLTAAVEAAETAADPAHELGDDQPRRHKADRTRKR